VDCGVVAVDWVCCVRASTAVEQTVERSSVAQVAAMIVLVEAMVLVLMEVAGSIGAMDMHGNAQKKRSPA
jgi:hypothetical protein